MRNARPRGRVVAAIVAGWLGAVAGSACDGLLKVESPTRVPASALDGPSRAPILVQSAVADFECAYANYVLATGMLSDELIAATTNEAPFVDSRSTPLNGVWGTGDCVRSLSAFHPIPIYSPLATARFQADDALRRIEAFPETEVPARNSFVATAAAYAGYSYVLFGEAFCQSAFDLGPARTPQQVFQIAEQRFTSAIEFAQRANDLDVLAMARVGRARARLDLGKKTDAAADARLVPTGFVKNATYSTANTRRENFVYDHNIKNRASSIDPRFRNLMVNGVTDPRVRTTDSGRAGLDGQTRVWVQTKYISESAPIAIASWNEAQLIIAEAEGGQSAVDRINALRARVALPSFASTDESAIVKQVLEERRRELFLDGHRLGDMIRLQMPFDTGVNHKGLTFGTATCFPLPSVELDNNPNLRAF